MLERRDPDSKGPPSGNSESGFSLVELLVVMLILGILAAIAIPAFFNQKQKANDAQAKAYVHAAQLAMETYATDNGSAYNGATAALLRGYEPTLSGANLALSNLSDTGYRIAVTAPVTAHVFNVIRNATTGAANFTCTPVSTGGCPAGGDWGQ